MRQLDCSSVAPSFSQTETFENPIRLRRRDRGAEQFVAARVTESEIRRAARATFRP